MTKKELASALELARIGEAEFDHGTLAVFDGFGLRDFEPVHVTLWAVSRLIRYQCLFIGGGWDTAALAELASAGRRNFLIIGDGAPEYTKDGGDGGPDHGPAAYTW